MIGHRCKPAPTSGTDQHSPGCRKFISVLKRDLGGKNHYAHWDKVISGTTPGLIWPSQFLWGSGAHQGTQTTRHMDHRRSCWHAINSGGRMGAQNKQKMGFSLQAHNKFVCSSGGKTVGPRSHSWHRLKKSRIVPYSVGETVQEHFILMYILPSQAGRAIGSNQGQL